MNKKSLALMTGITLMDTAAEYSKYPLIRCHASPKNIFKEFARRSGTRWQSHDIRNHRTIKTVPSKGTETVVTAGGKNYEVHTGLIWLYKDLGIGSQIEVQIRQ